MSNFTRKIARSDLTKIRAFKAARLERKLKWQAAQRQTRKLKEERSVFFGVGLR